jgi:hypothetical protein
MIRRISAPSPALVVAVIALFASIGGAAYAATTIRTEDIKDRAVTTQKLARDAVATRKIAPEAVKRARLDDHAVNADKLAFHAVITQKLEPGAVVTRKLADASVTGAKLAEGSVTAGKLATAVREDSVEVPNGSSGQVTSACDPGEKAMGGGATWSGDFDDAQAQQTHIVQSSPTTDGDAWMALGSNNSGTTRTLTVRVICVST